MNRRKRTSKPAAQVERRIATIGNASVTFAVREFKRLGNQGAAHIWGAHGEALGSDGPAVAGKFVGVRYRWERGHHGEEAAKLFDSEGAARMFALAKPKAMKAAKVPQVIAG